MSILLLARADVTIQVMAEPEFIPVEGNALASGDDAFDHSVEQGILERLRSGDVWAWTAITVTVAWEGQQASDHLGC